MTPTELPESLKYVLHHAWRKPFTTRSNFARELPEAIAAAASVGLITTQTAPKTFGNVWHITPQGLELLNDFYR